MRRLRRAVHQVVRSVRGRTRRPIRRTPRRQPPNRPGVAVFSLGRYAGPRRAAIVALKEHGRRDLTAPLAHAVALGIHRLICWGLLDLPFTVVPHRLGAPRPVAAAAIP